jgi:hypothetical protein
LCPDIVTTLTPEYPEIGNGLQLIGALGLNTSLGTNTLFIPNNQALAQFAGTIPPF